MSLENAAQTICATVIAVGEVGQRVRQDKDEEL